LWANLRQDRRVHRMAFLPSLMCYLAAHACMREKALLCRAALIVEGDDTLGRPGEIGHNEPHPRIKFARKPLDPGDDPAGHGPTGRLVAEVRLVPPHILRWPADRAPQKVGDIAL
jgi:hypothetical protein